MLHYWSMTDAGESSAYCNHARPLSEARWTMDKTQVTCKRCLTSMAVHLNFAVKGENGWEYVEARSEADALSVYRHALKTPATLAVRVQNAGEFTRLVRKLEGTPAALAQMQRAFTRELQA